MGWIEMHFDKRVLVGLALAMGLLAEGCASGGQPSGPAPAPQSPVVQVSPTTMGTPSPTDIEKLLNRISQFDQQVKQLAMGNPSPNDLLNTMQTNLTLMDYVTAYYRQMSPQQRTQALSGMASVLGDEVPVVNAQSRVYQATATAFALAYPTPTATPGTPTPVTPSPQTTATPTAQGTPAAAGTGTPAAPGAAGTPSPSVTAAPTLAPTSAVAATASPTASSPMAQVTRDLDAMRTEMVDVASGLPAEQDIVGFLGRLQADLTQMSQLAPSASDSEALAALNSMDSALADLVLIVRAYTGRQTSAIATPTPRTTPTSAPQ